ncbi:hypothetical protein [Hymenobacter metallilatus]|uniref:Uncharacterized protein n=1 Tax=Hymenobacter metallilatus TaxID=2493666 RepID=A0A3R9N6J7_9BACT|nr:hypothetical protein [Hymenobacter metallilatus]RSK24721.1 hypothetical protein EI290_18870 [Hymenobacter metallilatus]
MLPAESEQYRRHILTSPDLMPTEQVARYASRSFAGVWLHSEPETTFGFIGSDYQRLRVKLLTIHPDAQKPGRYVVTGKSQVRATVAPFQGSFTVVHVRENKRLPRTLDDVPSDAVKAGIVLAEYELWEPESQATNGVFRGIVYTQWYQDKAGKLWYNDLENFSDGYANNQFVGTWQSYKTGRTKRCNWGNNRVPNSGPLDQGVGEFSPTDAYLQNGWQSYRKAWDQNDKAAQLQERAAWWK